MLRNYIDTAMAHAHYEIIDQPSEPYFGEIPELEGVLATGSTLDECRANLEATLDAWIILGIQLRLKLPSIDGVTHS